MKKIILSILIVLLAVVFGFGQNTNTNSNSPERMTAEQIQQAKKVLEQFVGPKTDTSTSATKEQKTMADVLDKGIDLFAGYVTSVSEMMKSIAPEVWRVMIRQQYAKAITYPLTPLLLMVLLYMYHRILKNWFKISPDDKLFDFSDEYKKGRTTFLSIVPAVLGTILSIWFAIALSYAIRIAINPEYYALKDLLSMIIGQQGM